MRRLVFGLMVAVLASACLATVAQAFPLPCRVPDLLLHYLLTEDDMATLILIPEVTHAVQ